MSEDMFAKSFQCLIFDNKEIITLYILLQYHILSLAFSFIYSLKVDVDSASRKVTL